ncbi:hypothetical protein [Brochothrix campestris]|uniref:Uncharacterized protein n=1 Tax=Brochothrix campestris FSL F6-1037 TaxID=1265861 RepID=W7CXX3_9LIST|nr:hypothetical protein [Brochothrix campestris]EUJ41782.1 hypothetical protein BCAMP_02845 [Brochothrix campestris FSL F6-1037]
MLQLLAFELKKVGKQKAGYVTLILLLIAVVGVYGLHHNQVKILTQTAISDQQVNNTSIELTLHQLQLQEADEGINQMIASNEHELQLGKDRLTALQLEIESLVYRLDQIAAGTLADGEETRAIEAGLALKRKLAAEHYPVNDTGFFIWAPDFAEASLSYLFPYSLAGCSGGWSIFSYPVIIQTVGSYHLSSIGVLLLQTTVLSLTVLYFLVNLASLCVLLLKNSVLTLSVLIVCLIATQQMVERLDTIDAWWVVYNPFVYANVVGTVDGTLANYLHASEVNTVFAAVILSGAGLICGLIGYCFHRQEKLCLVK